MHFICHLERSGRGGKLDDRCNYYKRARLSTNKSQTVREVETQAACGAGRLEESDLFG